MRFRFSCGPGTFSHVHDAGDLILCVQDRSKDGCNSLLFIGDIVSALSLW